MPKEEGTRTKIMQKSGTKEKDGQDTSRIVKKLAPTARGWKPHVQREGQFTLNLAVGCPSWIYLLPSFQQLLEYID